MTDYYKLLGVEKNASKEEIKEAYERQVEKIKNEVVNEKRLNQFLKMIDEAYEILSSSEENKILDDDLTLVINPKEIQKELGDDGGDNNYPYRDNSKSKPKNIRRKKDNSYKKQSSNNKDKKKKENEDKEEKNKKQDKIDKNHKEDNKQIISLIMLPLKILLFPVICILTIMILLFKIINIVSWIVTKLLIIASISVGAIHLYQVKLGQTINYNILILAVSVLLASFFLPYILRFVLKVLKTINNILRGFVF